MQKVIAALERQVQKLSGTETTGHDWHHANQVRNTALRIADEEGGDRVIIEIASLVHDVGDHKLYGSKEAGRKVTCQVLADAGVLSPVLEQVLHIVDTMSYSGGQVPESLEGKIVQDADRLFALGAIGVARAFAYGGSRSRPLHVPGDESAPSTINHFYEKLLLVKDKMNTRAGRAIAQQRHDFMEDFLKQFYDEWNASY